LLGSLADNTYTDCGWKAPRLWIPTFKDLFLPDGEWSPDLEEANVHPYACPRMLHAAALATRCDIRRAVLHPDATFAKDPSAYLSLIGGPQIRQAWEDNPGQRANFLKRLEIDPAVDLHPADDQIADLPDMWPYDLQANECEHPLFL
jgi:hypothetical protein